MPVRKAGLIFGEHTEVCSQTSKFSVNPWALAVVLKSFSELSLQLSVLVWILSVTSDGLGL